MFDPGAGSHIFSDFGIGQHIGRIESRQHNDSLELATAKLNLRKLAEFHIGKRRQNAAIGANGNRVKAFNALHHPTCSRISFICQLLMSLMVHFSHLPILKVNHGTGQQVPAAHKQFRMGMVVIQLFGIAEHHGVGKRLQVIVHRDLAFGTSYLFLNGGVLPEALGHGFLVNGFFINPMFQERQLFAVRHVIPFRDKTVKFGLTEFGFAHRNHNRVFLGKWNIAARQAKERACTNSQQRTDNFIHRG